MRTRISGVLLSTAFLAVAMGCASAPDASQVGAAAADPNRARWAGSGSATSGAGTAKEWEVRASGDSVEFTGVRPSAKDPNETVTVLAGRMQHTESHTTLETSWPEPFRMDIENGKVTVREGTLPPRVGLALAHMVLDRPADSGNSLVSQSFQGAGIQPRIDSQLIVVGATLLLPLLPKLFGVVSKVLGCAWDKAVDVVKQTAEGPSFLSCVTAREKEPEPPAEETRQNAGDYVNWTNKQVILVTAKNPGQKFRCNYKTNETSTVKYACVTAAECIEKWNGNYEAQTCDDVAR
jgi:hypothetical protein